MEASDGSSVNRSGPSNLGALPASVAPWRWVLASFDAWAIMARSREEGLTAVACWLKRGGSHPPRELEGSSLRLQL